MPIPGLNAENCQRRNRLAARRDNVDAVPMRFLQGDGETAAAGKGLKNAFAVEDTKLAGSLGKLPASRADALAIINSLQPEDAEEMLTSEDVYIHYLEAANSNFIADRFMFLDDTTLQNIAMDAQAGFAFMNSHRTGGLSHPSELPFGRAFSGRFEVARDSSTRSLLGIYMLKGAKPNGDGGPSTDDMHRMIDAGTIFDVSVGLYGGSRVCDVCGNDLYAYDRESGEYLCPHAPGTQRGMSKDQVAAQTERGVTGGMASYSLVDSHCGEVSAVYDGAVPGAGFRKTLSFARQHALSGEEARQARHSYATLLTKGDFLVDEDNNGIIKAINEGFAKLGENMKNFFKKPEDTNPVVPPKTEKTGKNGKNPVRLSQNGDEDDLDEVEFDDTEALAKLETLHAQMADLRAQFSETKKMARAELLTQYKRDGKVAPGAEDLAAKLLEQDEETFAEFLDAQGKLAAFKTPEDGKENAGKSKTGSGEEIEQQLSETGDADNSLLNNLALKWCKDNGKDATKFENFSVALRQVAIEHPQLVAANHDAQARL